MRYISKFSKFNESRMSLTEGLLTNLFDKAKDGFKSIASKIPAVRNFFQNQKVKNIIAYKLFHLDNIDEMLEIVYEKIKKEKGEVTPTTIAEIAEQEEQRPEIFALIDLKQKTEPTTNEKKLIVKSLLELILLSLSIKASKTKDSQSGVQLDKTEMLKILLGDNRPKNRSDGFEDAMNWKAPGTSRL